MYIYIPHNVYVEIQRIVSYRLKRFLFYFPSDTTRASPFDTKRFHGKPERSTGTGHYELRWHRWRADRRRASTKDFAEKKK